MRRLSARREGPCKQARKDGRADRVAPRAQLTLRYQGVALPCPGAKPFELLWTSMRALEQRAALSVEPLEWFVR